MIMHPAGRIAAGPSTAPALLRITPIGTEHRVVHPLGIGRTDEAIAATGIARTTCAARGVIRVFGFSAG